MGTIGTVYIIGAGPADLVLLTWIVKRIFLPNRVLSSNHLKVSLRLTTSPIIVIAGGTIFLFLAF